MPFFEDEDLNENVIIPQIGTDLLDDLSSDEEAFNSGPVIPEVLLESLETVEASVVRLDDELNDATEPENDIEESDEDQDDEDIPTAPTQEIAAPKKHGGASLAAAANPKATSKAKEGASASRKRKADDAADEPATKRSGRGRATAAAASSAIKQGLAKRTRAPNGQAKAAPKKAIGAKRRSNPKTAQPLEEEFEVERIDDHRVNGKSTMYWVKWKGYPTKDNTWEPKSNLAHAADLLREYEAGAKEEKPASTSKKAATLKKDPVQKQQPGPNPKKLTAKKFAAKPAGRPAGRPGRPKRH